MPVTTHRYGTCWLTSSLSISSLDSWLPKTGLTSTFHTIVVRESEQILSMKLMNEWMNESEIKMEKAWHQTAATLPVPILQRISWGSHSVWYMLISIFYSYSPNSLVKKLNNISGQAEFPAAPLLTSIVPHLGVGKRNKKTDCVSRATPPAIKTARSERSHATRDFQKGSLGNYHLFLSEDFSSQGRKNAGYHQGIICWCFPAIRVSTRLGRLGQGHQAGRGQADCICCQNSSLCPPSTQASNLQHPKKEILRNLWLNQLTQKEHKWD